MSADVWPTAWLDARLAESPRVTKKREEAVTHELDTILQTRAIRTFLQPLVRMSDRAIVGYEALVRGPQGSLLERADKLFNAARATGRAVELELLCAELALERTRERLPAGRFLTINLGPDALLRADRLHLTDRAGLLFELTEHLPLRRTEGLIEAVAHLRAQGIGLALDDTGCGFANLDTVRLLQPEIVKLCITVVRNADKGEPYAAAIAATADRLRELRCRVLAEGVETETQHTALSGCAIELAQGWLYAKPVPVEEWY